MNLENKKHILVVEDEEHLAVGIKYNLEAEGFQVTAVGNGLVALQAIENEALPVDLIVLDLMLPGMSGYEVCERVRQAGKRMPILMLSARTLSEDRTRGFEVGASQYLVKPFELEELLARIKNLLSQNTVVGSGTGKLPAQNVVEYEFGDAVVNFQTYEISVRGKATRLTQLQIKVLKFFVMNEGVVVPRAKLLEEVWGMHGNMNTRAPDQVLRQLRKTFELNPSMPVHFLTIRDAGYRFLKNPVQS
ncbi:response regulator transcription factor [bacterium]|nr:response regulator transcription factor [Mariniblastus sp.]MDA7928805.1 response regulator transcription factor [Mariniblastus sp.]MDB4368415.1 response regulator transcription factor [Mariniblastus sp.]MDB4461634.1 response regulator transcription factor [bacterium]MDB4483802.1 response regulator transcription factor [bacterium]